MHNKSSLLRSAGILALTGVLFVANLVSAEDSPASRPVQTTLSAQDAAKIAIDANRDLAAARYIVAQSIGRLQQAGLWLNPELELARTTDRGFNDEGEYSGTVGFNQKFPISGRLSRAENVARVDVALAEAEIRDRERLLIGEVLQTARELLITDERLRLNQNTQKTLTELVNASAKRLRQAEVSLADLNLQKIELQRLALRASALNLEREKLRIALNHLLGKEPAERLQITDTMPRDVASFNIDSEAAIQRRPDRQIAALQIDRAAAEQSLARAERWEDWTIGLGYDRDVTKFNSSAVADKSDQFLGLRITIPLPLWNRNQGKLIETNAARSRTFGELQAIELKISAEIESAKSEVSRLSSILNQYEQETLKLAEENTNILKGGYSDGLIPISTVIQGQQQLGSIREDYAEALKAFSRAVTALETSLASNPLLERSSS